MGQTNLTYRDLEILTYLQQAGVATSQELTERFFCSKNACLIRVGRLCRHGQVEAVKLRDYLKESPSRFRGFAKTIGHNERAKNSLSLYRLGPAYKQKHDRVSEISVPIFWQHQIHLSAIRTFLERTLPTNGAFFVDTDIRREWARFKGGSNEPIPDLVWRENGDGREFAFEFERTNKGGPNYFERMIKLHKSRYNRVVYFAATDSILSTVTKAASAFPKIAVAQSISPSKVFSNGGGFKSISEFLGVSNVTS